MLAVGLILPMMQVSCVKEADFLNGDEATLRFSTDTVAFDTVFTTMGTTTRRFKVYNPHDQAVLINSVTLRKGMQSRFRLNVDGDTNMVVKNVELMPHDSLFVFVQANINPNAATDPFLVEDEVLFGLGQKVEKVALTAYGRNAIYHKPGVRGYSIIDCDNWDHTLPHVIMGTAVVDSACTLSLTDGDQLYFASNGLLQVYKGTIKAQGTKDRPVLFTSVRHDGWYDTLPGQWGYVLLGAESRGNLMEHVVVENGYVGLLVDSAAELTIRNSVVRAMSLAGILGQSATIKGDNLLVHTCQSATLALQHGGSYEFANSTFANYWAYDARPTPSVVLNNFYERDGVTYMVPLEKALFRNCIIYGSYGVDNGGEVNVYCVDEVAHRVEFDHCLVKLASGMAVDTMSVIVNQDPQFKNTRCDYHLKETSPAVGKGSSVWVAIAHDLDGNLRNNPPTIGAFEIAE